MGSEKEARTTAPYVPVVSRQPGMQIEDGVDGAPPGPHSSGVLEPAGVAVSYSTVGSYIPPNGPAFVVGW